MGKEPIFRGLTPAGLKNCRSVQVVSGVGDLVFKYPTIEHWSIPTEVCHHASLRARAGEVF
jgi:hypothetical protein